MQIVFEQIAEKDADAVVAHLQQMGYAARVEMDDAELLAIEQFHLEDIL